MRMHFARQVIGQGAPSRLALRIWDCCWGCRWFTPARLQLFKLQFQLLDLACDLLALGAEHHAPQLSDDQLQMFDLAVAATQLLLLCEDKSFERRSIQCGQISKSSASPIHATEYATDM